MLPFRRMRDLAQVLPADATVLGIVQQQVGQFATLLHQVDVRQSADSLHEAVRSDQFTKDQSGVVKTQGLVKIADE